MRDAGLPDGACSVGQDWQEGGSPGLRAATSTPSAPAKWFEKTPTGSSLRAT